MATDHPKPNEFTIGWICALPLELTACRVMLDQEFRDYEHADAVTRSDANTYVFGRVGKHNVIVACLPRGAYGETSAANLTTNMLASFPGIRFGLMVGIGGGVPSTRNDIRLGDVVVSQPESNHGGVIRYDLGKRTEHGFERTGALNQPPSKLLTALSLVISDNDLGLSRVPEFLARMNPKFQRPKALDRLYQASYSHVDPDTNPTCDTCDPTMVVARTERQTNDPVTFYGTIATGDSVIKSAKSRDELAEQHGALCFEMEAGGIMNTLPCLVIRGICDYCDSHKNKAWQNYAAVVAAAWAKELLYVTRPNMVTSMEPLVKEVQEIKTTLQAKVTRDSTDRIAQWLAIPDPSLNLNRALKRRHQGSGAGLLMSETFRSWKTNDNGSFLWLFGKAGCGKTVLSASIIDHMQQYSSGEARPVYFYFDFADPAKRSYSGLIKYLAFQLSHDQGQLAPEMHTFFEDNDQGRSQPTDDELVNLIDSVIDRLPQVYLIIDALDECEPKYEATRWLQRFVEARKSNVCILLTSREDSEIHEAFDKHLATDEMMAIDKGMLDQDLQRYVSYRVYESGEFSRWSETDALANIEQTIFAQMDGMFRWAACQLDELSKCVTISQLESELWNLPASLDETYRRMIQKIEAVHRDKARLLLQILTCSPRPLAFKEVAEALATNSTAATFDSRDRNLRPTDVAAMCRSLVTLEETKELQISPQYHHAGQTLQVRFSHFTVQQFLSSPRSAELMHGDFTELVLNTAVARSCLSYLCQMPNHISVQSSPDHMWKHLPWAQGAAHLWPTLAHIADRDGATSSLMHQFLTNTACFQIWASIYFSRQRARAWGIGLTDTHLIDPIHFALEAGAVCVVVKLWPNRAHFRSSSMTSDFEGCMLSAAAAGGHLESVRFLLDRNVKVSQNALTVSATKGHTAIVRTLLEHGDRSDQKATINFGPTALHMAAYCGHLGLVEYFFRKGVDINRASDAGTDESDNHWFGWQCTPLHIAAFRGHVTVARMLLDLGADVNSSNSSHMVDLLPVTEATELGGSLRSTWEFVTSKSSEKGTSMTVSSNDLCLIGYFQLEDQEPVKALDNVKMAFYQGLADGANPLHGACKSGNQQIVSLLLDNGAVLDATDAHGNTALFFASEIGSNAIIQMLLDAGASANHANEQGSSPLSIVCASTKATPSIVNILLERGANINNADTRGKTPLAVACARGDLPVVRLLLDNGAIIQAEADPIASPLNSAVRGGHVDILRLLLQTKGTGISSTTLGNLLFTSVEADNPIEIAKLLIDAGATVNCSSRGITTLAQATWKRRLDLVRLLIDNGADVNCGTDAIQPSKSLAAVHRILKWTGSAWKDRVLEPELLVFGTAAALLTSSLQGSIEITKSLIEAGANVNLQTGLFDNALTAASYAGRSRTVQLLLDSGADITRKNRLFGNVMAAALEQQRHRTEVVGDGGGGTDNNCAETQQGLESREDAKLSSMSDDPNETDEDPIDHEATVQILRNAGAEGERMRSAKEHYEETRDKVKAGRNRLLGTFRRK